VRPAVLMIRPMGVLGRPEGDENDELLLDVVEAMSTCADNTVIRRRRHGPHLT
jgi:hypothetical protein